MFSASCAFKPKAFKTISSIELLITHIQNSTPMLIKPQFIYFVIANNLEIILPLFQAAMTPAAKSNDHFQTLTPNS